jgi:hypothetical protein
MHKNSIIATRFFMLRIKIVQLIKPLVLLILEFKVRSTLNCTIK